MWFPTSRAHQQAADNNMEFANYGPFELLRARQLIESNIAEFAATQVTKQDIMKLMAIQEQARGEQCFRDSEWDLQFHIQVAPATQNSAPAAIVEKCGPSVVITRTGKTARTH